ncbi:MAG: hypothetical protein LWW86_11165 [Micrococcales bacterium]|nr:hypothetical protein [Micrococcales bacterium]
MAAYLVARARREHDVDVLAKVGPPSGRAALGALVLVAAMFALGLAIRDGWKPVLEADGKTAAEFIAQHVYYLAEVALVLLLVAFGQRAGELRWGRPEVPWGGLLAGLTWGLMHTLTQGSLAAGGYAALSGLALGTAYLLMRKDVRFAYPLLAVPFILC